MAGRFGQARMARRGGVLAAACAVVLLAGCGGSPTPLSKSAYDAKMAAIGKELSNDLNPLSAAKTAHAAVAALTQVQSELRSAQSQLAALTPPAAIKSKHAKLVADVGSFATELGPLIAELAKNDLGALSKVYTQPALLAIQNDSQAIEHAGYPINGTG